MVQINLAISQSTMETLKESILYMSPFNLVKGFQQKIMCITNHLYKFQKLYLSYAR